MRVVLGLGLIVAVCFAEDWPEWRGAGRLGVWNETGLIRQFPADGLQPVWRAPVAAGYSAPSVSAGRVYITDRQGALERAVCLDERSGKALWTREWKADYKGIDYDAGPRAAPTVDGDRVYVLGGAGHLACLRTRDGSVAWEKEYQRDYGAAVPMWGFASAPIVVGDHLIAVVYGRGNAKVVAFNKHTGAEVWKALSSDDSEPGYSQPILIRAGSQQQVVIWHAGAISALDPPSGRILWEHPFRIHMNTPIATPAYRAPYLLVSGFFNGARLLRLDEKKPGAELLWRGVIDRENNADTLHALMNSPVMDGDYIYGICSYGQLRCLRMSNGEQVWETQKATVERTRNVSAFIIRNGDRYILHNDRGEMIFAHLDPTGYEEISRTKLIKPTAKAGARREFGAVNWVHPAFANRHVIVRNDEEVLRYSFEGR